jgi:hypothetical protein
MTTSYTIGHSRHPGEHFVALLRAQEIAVLVDVRSHPASRWPPQFGKAAPPLAKGAERGAIARRLGEAGRAQARCGPSTERWGH